MLDGLIDACEPWASHHLKARAESAIRIFLDLAPQFTGVLHTDTRLSEVLTSYIRTIDDLISAQLREIFQAPQFRDLEATWRALEFLVSHLGAATDIKVKVLNISKKELLRDFQRAPEFDRSGLFKHVYEEELGTLSSEAFSLLLGDYSIGPSSQDIDLLKFASDVAASARAPFIAGVAPSMLRVVSFSELRQIRSLARLFDAPMYASWKSFRLSNGASHTFLALPRILLRHPVRLKREGGDLEAPLDEGLWGNGAFAVAAGVVAKFRDNGWFSPPGHELQGSSPRLPEHQLTDEFGNTILAPIEVVLSSGHRAQLLSSGFTPLAHVDESHSVAAPMTSSCCDLRTRSGLAEPELERLNRLEHVLAVGRISHYVKMIMRVKTWQSRDELQSYLREWIKQYLHSNHESSLPAEGRPFEKASIVLVEAPRGTAALGAVISLELWVP